LKLLKSGKPRIVVRISNKNIIAQIVEYKEGGDITKAEKTSQHLRKKGWKGHGRNLPAAYLVGLLIAKTALKSGIKEAVLDFGLQRKSSRLFAFAKGVADGGVNVNENCKVDENRMKGAHISDDVVKNFEDVKKKIIGKGGKTRKKSKSELATNKEGKIKAEK
jgi:large subunit ribosomal protein L18